MASTRELGRDKARVAAALAAAVRWAVTLDASTAAIGRPSPESNSRMTP